MRERAVIGEQAAMRESSHERGSSHEREQAVMRESSCECDSRTVSECESILDSGMFEAITYAEVTSQ